MGRLPLAALGVAGVLAGQFAWVKPTNFGGFDEWLFLWLGSRGILGSPYSGRPLNFLFTVPGALVAPHSFAGFHLAHAAYLALTGCAVLLIGRRLLPEHGRLALLAAVFAVAWAPSDMARLSTVQMTVNSGFAFGTAVAALLFVESWRRGSRLLLGAAAALELALVLGYEGVAPLLAIGPLLLLAVELRRRPRPARLWLGAWVAGGLAGLGLLAIRFSSRSALVAYQRELLGLDPHPGRVLGRLAEQFSLHLAPLFATPPRWLLVPATAASLAGFALAWLGASGRRAEAEPDTSRLLRLLALGAALAALGYLPFALTANVVGATRTQFLAMPGIGLVLAAAIGLLTAPLPRRSRHAAMALLGACVVALGAGRTAAMQRRWDAISFYEPQVRLLRSLVRLAPGLEPRTLVVLVDGARVFPSSFGFRHAIEYLYPGQAEGLAWGALEALYPTRFEASGILTEPWPVLREAWGVEPSLHRYDEVVAVRTSPERGLELQEAWPSELPPLPAGAAYDPRSRIRTDAPPVPERAILGPPGVRSASRSEVTGRRTDPRSALPPSRSPGGYASRQSARARAH